MNKSASQLRIYGLMPLSYSNGPGPRSVVWVQGCSLGCPDCFNPDSHGLKDGQVVGVHELFDRIRASQSDIEGVTISGGEPLQQADAILALLRELRAETDLSVVLFTGYTKDEVCRMNDGSEILRCVDVLLAGRFERNRRVARGLLGSANKQICYLTNRYGPADFESVPEAELVLAASGEILSTGIDPCLWERA